MMLYQPKGRKNWMSGWRGQDGEWVRVSLGTSSKLRATEFAGMLERLAEDHQWETLELLRNRQVGYQAAFSAYRNGNLGRLKKEAKVVDIEPLVAAWNRESGGRSDWTRYLYLGRLRALIPEGQRFASTQFTVDRVQTHLDAMPLKTSTRRLHAYTLRAFGDFMVRRGVIPENPLVKLAMPPEVKPRAQHLETPTVLALLDRCEPRDRAALALAYGGGLEVSVIVALTRRDVDVARREVRARGTKSESRDRVARIANWAWPIIEAHCANLLPGARLFPSAGGGNLRTQAGALSQRHKATLESMGLEGYTLHDARHYWAVRAVKAGVPLQVVATQLGHSDVAMVARIYGVYAPSAAERDHWESIITAHEAEEARKAG